MAHISSEEASKRQKSKEIDVLLIQYSSIKRDPNIAEDEKLLALSGIGEKIKEIQSRRAT